MLYIHLIAVTYTKNMSYGYETIGVRQTSRAGAAGALFERCNVERRFPAKAQTCAFKNVHLKISIGSIESS